MPLWREVYLDGLKVHVPWLWMGYVSHYDRECDFVAIPDDGMEICFGDGGHLQLIPVHFLHWPGNFSVFDPKAKALFSGDVGGALVPPDDRDGFVVKDFERHIQFMRGSHQRWKGSPAARDDWVRRISALAPEIIVPQRGLAFTGENAGRFLDWFETLEIGTVILGGMPSTLAMQPVPSAEPISAETPAPAPEKEKEKKKPAVSPVFGAGKPLARALKEQG